MEFEYGPQYLINVEYYIFKIYKFIKKFIINNEENKHLIPDQIKHINIICNHISSCTGCSWWICDGLKNFIMHRIVCDYKCKKCIQFSSMFVKQIDKCKINFAAFILHEIKEMKKIKDFDPFKS